MIAAAQPDLWELTQSSGPALLGLLALILFAIWMIVRIRERFRDREDHAATPHQLLMQYREMQREGDLTDEEYRSIKSRLVQQVECSARGTTILAKSETDKPAETTEQE